MSRTTSQTMLSGIRLTVSSLVLCLANSAGAQENLDKNKTGAQLYASHCAACHKSPQSVTKTTANFVSEHYPVSPKSVVAPPSASAQAKRHPPSRRRAIQRGRISRAAGREAATSGNKAGEQLASRSRTNLCFCGSNDYSAHETRSACSLESVGPTHFFFPELDYSVRKFTRPDACASAGFRPHFE